MHWIISLLCILCGIFYDIWKYCYNLLKRLVFAPLCWWHWTFYSRHVCSNVALCRNHSFVEELLERQQDSITYLTERCQHLTELLLTHPSGVHMSPGSSIYDLSASVMSSSAMITDWWPKACNDRISVNIGKVLYSTLLIDLHQEIAAYCIEMNQKVIIC